MCKTVVIVFLNITSNCTNIVFMAQCDLGTNREEEVEIGEAFGFENNKSSIYR